jgi:hypothetical protein
MMFEKTEPLRSTIFKEFFIFKTIPDMVKFMDPGQIAK